MASRSTFGFRCRHSGSPRASSPGVGGGAPQAPRLHRRAWRSPLAQAARLEDGCSSPTRPSTGARPATRSRSARYAKDLPPDKWDRVLFDHAFLGLGHRHRHPDRSSSACGSACWPPLVHAVELPVVERRRELGRRTLRQAPLREHRHERAGGSRSSRAARAGTTTTMRRPPRPASASTATRSTSAGGSSGRCPPSGWPGSASTAWCSSSAPRRTSRPPDARRAGTVQRHGHRVGPVRREHRAAPGTRTLDPHRPDRHLLLDGRPAARPR